MSIKSWKQQFYAQGASTLARKRGVTDIELIDHCITKWEGARTDNVIVHRVQYRNNVIIDHDFKSFEFDSSSCALCQKYYRKNESCGKCPLKGSRNGVPCYERLPGEATSPYSAESPAPMIRALRKARVFALKQVEK